MHVRITVGRILLDITQSALSVQPVMHACFCLSVSYVDVQLLHRIENITHLVISDTIGEDRSFLNDAVELRPGGVEETVRLRGPGELLLLSSNATLLRDSQVCVSTSRTMYLCTEPCSCP